MLFNYLQELQLLQNSYSFNSNWLSALLSTTLNMDTSKPAKRSVDVAC